MILLLSDTQTDAHVEAVGAELSRRGEAFVVFDPAMYPAESQFTFEDVGGRLDSTMVWDGKAIDLSQVRSVWWRRPGETKLSPTLRPEERKWLKTECAHALRGLWATVDALWVSPPQNIRQASLKLWQLLVARELGFRVPAFIVTNQVDRAAAFIAAAPGKVIVKVLANPTIFNRTHAATIYTHVVTRDDEQQLDAVRYGPTFLQHLVVKRKDIRVTVIGDSVFAAAIDSVAVEEGRIDFRRAEVFDLPHDPIELPQALKTACQALVRRLGLRFGAIDLLLTDDGEYHFLEINPNGQWLWIEWTTEMPLTKAMCDLLVRPERTVKSTRRRSRSTG